MRPGPVCFVLLAVLLVYDLVVYLAGRETVSQWAGRMGQQHPWVPIVAIVVAVGLWFHFWGPPYGRRLRRPPRRP
jgi:hypothetical protein